MTSNPQPEISVLLALLELVGALQVQFELALRDELLLLFFATIGLQAKLARLKSGGPVLLRMLGVTVAFLLLQNLGGVATALALGEPAGFGLMGGSVSLAGGHGTAITWGTIAVERGAEGALEIGLAFATFGLILGGCVGGPLANNLIRSHGLETPGTGKGEDAPGEEGEKVRSITTSGVSPHRSLPEATKKAAETGTPSVRERASMLFDGNPSKLPLRLKLLAFAEPGACR